MYKIYAQNIWESCHRYSVIIILKHPNNRHNLIYICNLTKKYSSILDFFQFFY